jgi:hypothetical protein
MMARRPKYNQEKRLKELEREKKKENKKVRKLEREKQASSIKEATGSEDEGTENLSP